MADRLSLTITAHQRPFSPNNDERIRTEAIWNTMVLLKEIMALRKPSLREVNQQDEKKFIPQIKKESI